MQLLILLAVYAAMLAISSSFFVALHKRYGRFGSVLMCSIGLTAGSVLQFVMEWFTPHVLLLSIFGIVIKKDVSQRVRVGGTLIISSVVLFLLTWFGLAERSRIIALQKEFPVVSLKERLAYEET
jgi:MFS family permease